MGVVQFVSDKLENLTSKLGTSRDKATHTKYAQPVIDDQELTNAYRGAWLPQKIVNIPAKDAGRNWRNWQARNNQIELIEAEEIRLNLRGKVIEALIKARLLGGAAILIGDGAEDTEDPLNVEAISKGGIKYLTVLSRRECASGLIDVDPTSPYYGMPEDYQLNAKNGSILRIHPSRLVIFHGSQRPDLNTGTLNTTGWGDSALTAVMDAVKQLDGTAANIASLIYEAKVDVLSIPNFMQNVGTLEGEQKYLKRLSLGQTAKGNNGTLLLDKDEEYQQKTQSFSTLPEILDRFMQIVSGAADIPATRLFGQAPSGMSATGESDSRNYYDRISAMQTLEIQPAMSLLDECLIRSALGSRPSEIHYVWAPLWQPTAKERAEIGKIDADTIKTIADTQLIPEEALWKSAVNMLVEHSVMPGLEGHLEDYDSDDDPDIPEE